MTEFKLTDVKGSENGVLDIGGFKINTCKLSNSDYLQALVIGLRQMHTIAQIPLNAYIAQEEVHPQTAPVDEAPAGEAPQET